MLRKALIVKQHMDLAVERKFQCVEWAATRSLKSPETNWHL